MKIRGIQTGTVAVTSAWREGVGHGKGRLLHTIVDREWTEPLPIYAFAIEHPEGVIVVDTGEDARASQRSYFARWHPGLRAFREWVKPEQEIGPQLKRLGIQSGDVRWVVMTHLHTDHAGSLHHFPDNEILVTRTELEYGSGLRGRLRDYVANTLQPTGSHDRHPGRTHLLVVVPVPQPIASANRRRLRRPMPHAPTLVPRPGKEPPAADDTPTTLSYGSPPISPHPGRET
jgi:glyoxylase-like metal-dependent hydrolase (beta-lactamase superfamily II)